MIPGLRVPGWLRTGLLDRYHSGASHLFLLEGNVRDVHPFGDAYRGLAEGLRTLAAAREVVVSYDVSAGLPLHRPDGFGDHGPSLYLSITHTF